MRGARKYHHLFKNFEIVCDRLFIVKGDHARGKTFTITMLPKDFDIEGYKGSLEEGHRINCYAPASHPKSVNIYDVVSGQRGWTEVYGWLHQGKWVDDFEAEYQKRLKAYEDKKEAIRKENEEKALQEKQRELSLLSDY